MLFDSVLVEGILKHFVVINKFVVMLGRPFDLLEVEGLGIDRVHNLAVNSGSCALLDLGDVQLIIVTEVYMVKLTGHLLKGTHSSIG